MILKNYPLYTGVLLACTLLYSTSNIADTTAAGPGKVFYTPYQSAAPVAVDQVQVIYYRPVLSVQRQGAAHVYVDRQFQTGLLPGGYTQFCLAPGTHTLGAYLDDAPAYRGKRHDLYQANLQAGRTYFLRVREDASTFPQPVSREEAEGELKSTRAQAHVLSRVDSVEACRHYAFLKRDSHVRDYRLNDALTFAPRQTSRQYLSGAGHAALRQLVEALRQDQAQIKRILVTGHADPMGNTARNEMLGHQRADTVGEMLMDAGIAQSLITTASAGSREPVVHTCYGTYEEQVACYAPNRRVTLKVELETGTP
ncbi:OmpA family protein [Pseudomonas sp. L1(2025)]|uniref:OmpA family protein n=1 Tax=Pseudomonas sp. L1(2025) TaxID=3449429 RepID=UPI003F68F92E